MNPKELDTVYGELCRALSSVGESQAPLLLARFALLAIAEIDDSARALELVRSAQNVTQAPARR